MKPGETIRHLRHERQLSLESLAAAAGLTSVGLSNIELKAARPQRETLLAIITALDQSSPVAISDRTGIMSTFGYDDTPGLPGWPDIERAIAAWREPFKESPYPAYLVDIAQRIHDWNDSAVALLGAAPDPGTDLTVFDLMFSPPARGRATVANEEEIIRKVVAYMWSEYQPFLAEEWYKDCIAKASAMYPIFANLYGALGEKDTVTVDIRSIEPVVFKGPEGALLSFRIVGTDLVSDPRFRAVQYIPLDHTTAQMLPSILK